MEFFKTQLNQNILFCTYRDLIFIWSKLQLKSNPSKQVFVDQCYQLLRIATNVRVIFPFMKVIKDEVSFVLFSFFLPLPFHLFVTNKSEEKCFYCVIAASCRKSREQGKT